MDFKSQEPESKGFQKPGAGAERDFKSLEPNIGIRAEGILKTKSQSRRGFQKPGAGAEGDFKSKELEPKGISKARSRSRRGFQKPRARADRSLAGSREHCFW